MEPTKRKCLWKFSGLILTGLCINLTNNALAAPLPLDCRLMFANPVIVQGTTGNDYITSKGRNTVEVRKNNANGQLIGTYTKPSYKSFLINAGPGNDTVFFSSIHDSKVQICTGAHRDKVDLWLSNGATRGWVFMGSGNDTYQGTGDVRVDAGAGDDTARGWGSLPSVNDDFVGGSGHDCLLSNSPKGQINGGTGNDYMLTGKHGYMHGSGGADTCFVHGDETISSCENVVAIANPTTATCKSLGYTR